MSEWKFSSGTERQFISSIQLWSTTLTRLKTTKQWNYFFFSSFFIHVSSNITDAYFPARTQFQRDFWYQTIRNEWNWKMFVIQNSQRMLNIVQCADWKRKVIIFWLSNSLNRSLTKNGLKQSPPSSKKKRIICFLKINEKKKKTIIFKSERITFCFLLHINFSVDNNDK